MKVNYPILTMIIVFCVLYSCQKKEQAVPATAKTSNTDSVKTNGYPYTDTLVGKYRDTGLYDAFSFVPISGYDSPFVFLVVHISPDQLVFMNDSPILHHVIFAYTDTVFIKDTFTINSNGIYNAPLDPSRLDQWFGDYCQYANSDLIFNWGFNAIWGCAYQQTDSCKFIGRKISR